MKCSRNCAQCCRPHVRYPGKPCRSVRFNRCIATRQAGGAKKLVRAHGFGSTGQSGAVEALEAAAARSQPFVQPNYRIISCLHRELCQPHFWRRTLGFWGRRNWGCLQERSDSFNPGRMDLLFPCLKFMRAARVLNLGSTDICLRFAEAYIHASSNFVSGSSEESQGFTQRGAKNGQEREKCENDLIFQPRSLFVIFKRRS